MPQLNFYTYLSQTTWTILLFSVFYYFFKQYLLPSTFESLKIQSLYSPSSVYSSHPGKGVLFKFSYDSLLK